MMGVMAAVTAAGAVAGQVGCCFHNMTQSAMRQRPSHQSAMRQSAVTAGLQSRVRSTVAGVYHMWQLRIWSSYGHRSQDRPWGHVIAVGAVKCVRAQRAASGLGAWRRPAMGLESLRPSQPGRALGTWDCWGLVSDW